MLRRGIILTVLSVAVAVGAFAAPASAMPGVWAQSTCVVGAHMLTVDTHYTNTTNAQGLVVGHVFDQIRFRLSGSATGGSSNFNTWITQTGAYLFWYYSPDNIQGNTDYVLYLNTTSSALNPTTLTFEAIFDESWAPDPRCTATLVIPGASGSPLTANNPGTQTTAVYTPASLTLTASGGAPPYQWSSTALPAGLSLNAGTGVISGTPTVPGTTSITATVRDGYNFIASTTFSWVVTAGLSVGISGPYLITAKGTYTFTAEYSGFNPNPGFAWSERFCYDAGNANCSSWVALTGVGASLNRVLNKDCSGIGENSYQLALTMTNSNGATASTEHTAYLCGAVL